MVHFLPRHCIGVTLFVKILPEKNCIVIVLLLTTHIVILWMWFKSQRLSLSLKLSLRVRVIHQGGHKYWSNRAILYSDFQIKWGLQNKTEG